MARIAPFLEELVERGGSDLHLAQGERPKIRLHGRLTELDHPVLDGSTIRAYMEEVCPADRWRQFIEKRDADFAYALDDRARFRVNYYCHAHGMGAVFRLIPTEIRSLEDLRMPEVLGSFAELRSGLVLVTGPTGSGKSTTLAAIIDRINASSARHIVTIEEPIEFVHRNNQSIICQREVGVDAHSFADALRAAVRQDCDVVMVGEMRDYTTISLAVSAATMGSLVFATLHTMSAVKTVDRIIEAFPAGKQPQIRTMLAECLRGICAQLLLRRADGEGRVAATEILLANSAVSNSIREGNTQNLRNIIQSGRSEGMQLMDDSLLQLLRDKVITPEEAYLNAGDKTRFRASQA